MIKGLVFDYGGTLDTGGCHWGKVLWHAYMQSKVPVSEEIFRKAYVHGERTLATKRIITPRHTFLDTLSEKIRLQLEWIEKEEGKELMKPFHDYILNKVYSFARSNTENSVKVLHSLADRYPMVLVSNFYGNIATVLKEFGFDGIFKDIIESAVVGIRKPNPEIFAIGVEKLGMANSEAMVIGDSYDKDILPAHSIGCKTAWIKGEGWTDEEVTEPVADFTIHYLQELKGILLK